MPRTAAKLSQADIRRVIRAAKAENATCVRVLPDGSMHVDLAELAEEPPKPRVDGTARPRL